LIVILSVLVDSHIKNIILSIHKHTKQKVLQCAYRVVYNHKERSTSTCAPTIVTLNNMRKVLSNNFTFYVRISV